ncbi:MAG: T9SS type A sorting domain-containing protein [Flavobacteriales bacterium]|jgi:hypothetical protein|nr:T9SS type A sorting domain-containing protein [Flavobacteriales bacterium]
MDFQTLRLLSGKQLHQNRPNPFRDMTTFSYSLANAGKVELNIYSMEGMFIKTIANGLQQKGEHKVEWDSKDMPNGMYFYILTVDGVEWVKKAIRLRGEFDLPSEPCANTSANLVGCMVMINE